MFIPENPLEAYKYGVNSATDPAPVNNLADTYFNAFLSDRRKTLLTDKVTKWIIVRKAGGGYADHVYEGRLHDRKEAAEKSAGLYLNSKDILGVFPVEIEFPL